MLVPGAAEVGPAPEPEVEPEEEEDVVEEVQGHPRDGQQHVYVSRWCNDQWVFHEEIPEVEEAEKVERATKRLMTEVKVSFA